MAAASPEDDIEARFKSRKNSRGTRYLNITGEKRPNVLKVAKWLLTVAKPAPPSREELNLNLPVLKAGDAEIAVLNTRVQNGIQFTWIGHSTVLVQIDGLNILTDPIFSERCAPVNMHGLGYVRFRDVPLTIQQLPQIDAVIISHDHYDHLDLKSVKELNARFKDTLQWFIPEGLGRWFTSTGIKNYTELDWWQNYILKDVKFIFTPAQHWSRRGVNDENKSLWGSWCILGPQHRFFFGGDTGYCDVFQEIGRRYGPFDLAAIPIGAYHPRWMMSVQHVDPAQAVMIHSDVKAIKSFGIHWGTFPMANESYLEPKTQLAIELNTVSIPQEVFFTVKHGQITDISDMSIVNEYHREDAHPTHTNSQISNTHSLSYDNISAGASYNPATSGTEIGVDIVQNYDDSCHQMGHDYPSSR